MPCETVPYHVVPCSTNIEPIVQNRLKKHFFGWNDDPANLNPLLAAPARLQRKAGLGMEAAVAALRREFQA